MKKLLTFCLFGGILAIPCLLGFMFSTLGDISICQSVAMSSWAEVPAEISQVRLYLKSTRSQRRIRELNAMAPEWPGRRQKFELETDFRYEFDGHAFAAKQIVNEGGCKSIQRLATQLDASVRSAQPTACFVNPAAPEQAVVAKTAARPFLLMVGAIILCLPCYLVGHELGDR